MLIFAQRQGDKVLVQATADAEGVHGYMCRAVRPGGELFGFTYEELARGGTFEVTPERWQRYRNALRPAAKELSADGRARAASPNKPPILPHKRLSQGMTETSKE